MNLSTEMGSNNDIAKIPGRDDQPPAIPRDSGDYDISGTSRVAKIDTHLFEYLAGEAQA